MTDRLLELVPTLLWSLLFATVAGWLGWRARRSERPSRPPHDRKARP